MFDWYYGPHTVARAGYFLGEGKLNIYFCSDSFAFLCMKYLRFGRGGGAIEGLTFAFGGYMREPCNRKISGSIPVYGRFATPFSKEFNLTTLTMVALATATAA